MATWTSGAELTARYAVQEERLTAYARRGSLGVRRLPDGVRLFDEERVAKLFRRRSESAHDVSLLVLGREPLARRDEVSPTRSYIAPRGEPLESVVIPLAPRLPRLVG